jgi:hypothetical protein
MDEQEKEEQQQQSKKPFAKLRVTWHQYKTGYVIVPWPIVVDSRHCDGKRECSPRK